MHRKTSNRSIPLTEKVKHPQPSTSMTVHKIEENSLKNDRPMVYTQNPYTKTARNVQNREYVNPWPKAEEDSWSWDRRSSGTSISWPEEMEEVATKKVMDQWEAVQRTLYDENDQVTSEGLRAECIQWRTQRPHLRVLGKGFRGHETANEKIEDPGPMSVTKNDNPIVEEVIEEHNVPENSVQIPLKHAPEDCSPKGEYREQTGKEVLDLILDFVCAQLLANNEDDESLIQNLDAVLRITPAPTYSGRNPLRNHSTANEFVIPTYHRIKLHKDELRDCSDALEFSVRLPEVQKSNFQADKSRKVFVGRGSIMSISARRQRDIRDIAADGILINSDRLYTPQLPRNALGTVFTEKIIVSPVPFATSTKESFSTLKTTPLRSMRLSLESSPVQRSARSVNSGFKVTPVRRAGLLQIPQVHSAWQAPVCPTVWPKNVKLAPIDITRLPSSRRRSLATSLTQPRRSRNSLSPIPRELMPVSPLAIREADTRSLEIHGKQIVRQKSRMSMTSAGWDSSPRNIKKLEKKMKNNNER